MKKQKPEAWGLPVSFRLDEETLKLIDQLDKELGHVGRSATIKVALRLAIKRIIK